MSDCSVAPVGQPGSDPQRGGLPKMAKALFGHIGVSADPRLVDEVRRLRARVTELETRLDRAHAVNDALAAAVTVEDDIRLLTEEPALT